MGYRLGKRLERHLLNQWYFYHDGLYIKPGGIPPNPLLSGLLDELSDPPIIVSEPSGDFPRNPHLLTNWTGVRGSETKSNHPRLAADYPILSIVTIVIGY